MDKVGAMHDCITDRVPRQHKDAANGQFQLERGFLTEECFLEERWAQFIYRNKMVCVACVRAMPVLLDDVLPIGFVGYY
jgi:hypothetical protein